MTPEKLQIKKDTIIRTILLVLAMVNNALALFGKSPLPFKDQDVTQVISMVFSLATAAWAWWKNNSVTKEAIEADEIMHEAKRLAKEAKEESNN